MNNNEWPDHLWVTTFFSRTSWTFYALTHFDQIVRIRIHMKDPSDRIVFVLPSRCSLSVGRFTKRAYVYYMYAFLSAHSSRRGIFPRHLDGLYAVVHAIRKERTKFDCTRSTRRGQVLVVFSSERKRRPLRSRGSPVWFVTIDQLYTLGVSRRVVFLRRLHFCRFSPTWYLFFDIFWNVAFENLSGYPLPFLSCFSENLTFLLNSSSDSYNSFD